jgi:hypothetical protein
MNDSFVCVSGNNGGILYLFLGSVLEGQAWWEQLQLHGQGGPGATALADSFSFSEGAARLCRIELLKLR